MEAFSEFEEVESFEQVFPFFLLDQCPEKRSFRFDRLESFLSRSISTNRPNMIS